MAGSPSEEEIMAAIQASGYLMEQEVATQLERRGLHVRTNVAFEDCEEGKSREIDVTAITRVAVDETEKVGAHVKPWKTVQFCRIDRQGKGWHANHGGLYDAILYPMAKVLNARRKERPKPTRAEDWHYIWLYFPLVVTSGDLFLIDASAEAPRPEPVDHGSFQRELKSAKLSGSFMVTFVRQKALESFMADVVDPLSTLCRDLIENWLAFIREKDLPWVD